MPWQLPSCHGNCPSCHGILAFTVVISCLSHEKKANEANPKNRCAGRAPIQKTSFPHHCLQIRAARCRGNCQISMAIAMFPCHLPWQLLNCHGVGIRWLQGWQSSQDAEKLLMTMEISSSQRQLAKRDLKCHGNCQVAMAIAQVAMAFWHSPL